MANEGREEIVVHSADGMMRIERSRHGLLSVLTSVNGEPVACFDTIRAMRATADLMLAAADEFEAQDGEEGDADG